MKHSARRAESKKLLRVLWCSLVKDMYSAYLPNGLTVAVGGAPQANMSWQTAHSIIVALVKGDECDIDVAKYIYFMRLL